MRRAVAFSNVYDDPQRAAAYATLEFPGTYFLAFRDLPGLLGEGHGRRALDFGCGAGRSTRFLKRLGFEATGIDVSASMVALARQADPRGDYRHADIRASDLPAESFDVVLSAFAFDNIPKEDRQSTLRALGRLLRPAGRLVLLGSRPEIYTHEWASFTTKAYPENARARSGESVRIVMKDVPDARPVEDLLWTHEDYMGLFQATGFDVLSCHMPLGRPDEGQEWVSETHVAPWVIYVLARAGR